MQSGWQLLNILCDPEDGRRHVNNPWHENGYSYSTNGCCCLRVPGNFGEKGDNSYPKMCDFKWDALNDESLITYISPSHIKENARPCTNCRVDISESITGPCPECRGFGETKCFYCESEIECEDCGGSGLTTIGIPRMDCDECLGTGVKMSRYVIGHKKLNTVMLLLLLDNLPNLRFLPGKKVIDDAIGFRFGINGMGALMPMRD